MITILYIYLLVRLIVSTIDAYAATRERERYDAGRLFAEIERREAARIRAEQVQARQDAKRSEALTVCEELEPVERRTRERLQSLRRELCEAKQEGNRAASTRIQKEIEREEKNALRVRRQLSRARAIIDAE